MNQTLTIPLPNQPADIDRMRINSIDVLRGIVMVIMALDHTRDFFHINANLDDPLNLKTTTTLLYATRWVTHFCAPVFVFLSGISIYLQSLRKTRKELSVFLIKRGLWLIFVEIAIVTLGITFDPLYHFIVLQVIWAIGISMVLLGLLIWLPLYLIFGLGVIIVLGHNILDSYESVKDFKAGFWWELIHRGGVKPYGTNRFLGIFYPFLPWTGLMMLGYSAGTFFTSKVSAIMRKRILIFTGIGLILFFVIVRFINVYGDPNPWTFQKDNLYTFFSFMKVHKYPPSLLYMCITIGPALVLLAFLEKIKNAFTDIMSVYGRTAFFYYILHFFLIHTLSSITFFAKGHSFQDAINSMQNLPFMFVVPGEGFDLGIVYLVWAAVVIALYPLCKRYDRYKKSHKEKWWLSYL